jgi:DNA-binding transcriptional regulator YhcF (GntR family)
LLNRSNSESMKSTANASMCEKTTNIQTLNRIVHKNIPVTRQREELLNDPAAHLVLRKTASEGEKDIEELAGEIGVEHYRVRKRSRELETHGFARVQQGRKIIIEDGHREKLEAFRDSLLNFAEKHHERLSRNFDETSKVLNDKLEELEKEKKETDSVKKEKKIDRKLEAVEEALDQETDSPRKSLQAFSRVHRARKFLDLDVEFHGFNPVRKSKTLTKVEKILSEEPSEERPRTFFGNRWVVKDSL